MYLDISVMLSYAVGMLALGWLGMRRSKSQEDFLVAGRQLGPGLYMSTMAATVLGGASTIGSVRLGYVHGISGVWLCAAIGIGIIILSLLLSEPLIKQRIFTVTQVLERRYNPLTRQVSGVIMVAYALMIGVVSTLGISTVLQVFMNLSFPVALLVGGGIIITYATFGGMWAVTMTDAVQFIIATIGFLFLLLPISLYRVGGWNELVAELPVSSFNFGAIGVDTIVTYILIYTFGVLIGQDIWQRVFTARSPRVARVAGAMTGLYCVLYGLAAAVIGMCARLLLPELDDANNALAAIIHAVLPVGVRSLVIAAAVAAMMSTASSGILAASSTVAEDLLPKLRGGKESSVNVMRICTLASGAVVLSVGLFVSDVLSALMMAYNLLVGGMLIPLIGAIFWKSASPAGAMASMALGALTAIAFMLKDGIDANSPIYFSLAIGLVAYVSVSLLFPRQAIADSILKDKTV